MPQLDLANDDLALAFGREYLANLLKDRFLRTQAEKIQAQEAHIQELEASLNALNVDAKDGAETPATADLPAE